MKFYQTKEFIAVREDFENENRYEFDLVQERAEAFKYERYYVNQETNTAFKYFIKGYYYGRNTCATPELNISKL